MVIPHRFVGFEPKMKFWQHFLKNKIEVLNLFVFNYAFEKIIKQVAT